MPTNSLYDRTGGDYSQQQLRQILDHSPKSDTLWRWRKTGDGPPFRRLGRKHARVMYPRRQFWEWFDSFLFQSEDEAAEAGHR